jgi:hypothetical protein
MAYRIRVNTNSKSIAELTRKFLTAKLKHGFDLAISSKTMLMIDIDDKDYGNAKYVTENLSMYFKADSILIETPNGFHIVVLKSLGWTTVERYIKNLLEVAETYRIDRAHLEACLRRGYMTIRCNGTRFWRCVYAEGEVKWRLIR